ncbi:MAG: hypothetical protein U5R06_23665 [candidate division KSB1 bacterium]|nr:hypothetical protein [candidate division KSB1 bacterium]
MRAFERQTDLLMLDFDGVITQSIDECLVSGHNAYADYRGGSRVERIADLDREWVDTARYLRSFIRNGEDYVYIAHALASGEKVNDQDDFDAFKQSNIDLKDTFFDRFVQARHSFARSRPEQWCELSPLYPGMAGFLKDYEPGNNLYIITTKLLVFVREILSFHNIDLQQENLFDTRDGRSKSQIITDILANRQISKKQCYFLDDQVDTVIKVYPTGIHAILALWGYNNPEQVETARSRNIETMTRQAFFQFFA